MVYILGDKEETEEEEVVVVVVVSVKVAKPFVPDNLFTKVTLLKPTGDACVCLYRLLERIRPCRCRSEARYLTSLGALNGALTPPVRTGLFGTLHRVGTVAALKASPDSGAGRRRQP